jgi:hypothetical protein
MPRIYFLPSFVKHVLSEVEGRDKREIYCGYSNRYITSPAGTLG